MTTLFNQEKLWEIELYNTAQEAEAKGKAEGRAEGEFSTIKKLLATLPAEEISKLLDKPLAEIRAIAQAEEQSEKNKIFPCILGADVVS